MLPGREDNMIYFDMDGTLADFEGGVRDICGFSAADKNHPDEEQDNRMWEGIRKAGDFYYRLKPLPGAIELFWKVYEKYGDECRILTGIPSEARGIVTAAEDKKAWVRDLIGPEVIAIVCPRKEKQLYATDNGDPCVLIDDLPKTIREWEADGGIGILYTNAEEAEEQLCRLEII